MKRKHRDIYVAAAAFIIMVSISGKNAIEEFSQDNSDYTMIVEPEIGSYDPSIDGPILNDTLNYGE